MAITKRNFGKTSKGEEVTLYSLENEKGMRAEFIDYGAVLVNLFVADKEGKLEDVVLGFDNVADYEVNGCFFGSFIGRHGNRIGNATFTINGTTYHVEKNDGENNLHGGEPGFNKVMYDVTTTENSITFHRISPDGEQGFPGNLDVSVTYTLTDDNELMITYQGKADEDTIVNLTNHSYFNLAGHKSGKILDHKVVIKANAFTPTNDALIPMGEIMDVTGTPMDFRKQKRIGDEIDADFKPIQIAGGYDHNYVLDRKDDGEVTFVAELTEEKSGRKMEVYTDMVGMQFYSGNFINGEKGKEGACYEKRDGVCFETQYFPNSMNVPTFKSCVVKANEPFKSTTKYVFTTI